MRDFNSGNWRVEGDINIGDDRSVGRSYSECTPDQLWDDIEFRTERLRKERPRRFAIGSVLVFFGVMLFGVIALWYTKEGRFELAQVIIGILSLTLTLTGFKVYGAPWQIERGHKDGIAAARYQLRLRGLPRRRPKQK